MRSGENIASVPLEGVKTVVVFDSVSLTAPALDLLLRLGIDVIYQSKWGKIKGSIRSAKGSGAITRLAQFSAFVNPERRLELAKTVAAAKIHNQMTAIRKYKYHDTNTGFDEHLSAIKNFIQQLEGVDTVSGVMGIEGVSARYYWDCFKDLLKTQAFTRREYRPSPDYVNALLNLGYAFLCNEVTACLVAKHFDLEIGFLHSIHYGRNSLALDMMEEFRATFIDMWVLSLLNKNQLKEGHFYMGNGDWRLTEEGFHKFCELYHKHVGDWRGRFQKQADRLKDALVKGGAYEPYHE